MHWIAPSQKDTTNGTLEKRLWEAADRFRANSGLTSRQYDRLTARVVPRSHRGEVGVDEHMVNQSRKQLGALSLHRWRRADVANCTAQSSRTNP